MTAPLGSHVFEGSCDTTLLLQTCLGRPFTDGNVFKQPTRLFQALVVSVILPLLINPFFFFLHQVTKLQSDISPLHHSLSVLSEKNSSLQADKRLLEEDVKRWKARTQVSSL